MNDPALKKALGVLEIMNFTDDEWMAYEDRLKWFMIESNTLRKYEGKGFERGLEVGIAEGERKKAIAISKNMLFKGMDLETVSSITGLSVEEISQL